MRAVFFYKPHQKPAGDDINWRWWLKVWAPVLIAVAVICVESTDTFSAENTSNWLRPLVERWLGPISDNAWFYFHHYLRKTGHFVGYGTVGLTFLRAWLYTLGRRGQMTLRSWRLESCILAIFSTAIIASCDEFHQSFIPSRTGTPLDVLLDSTGAFVLCLLVWLVCWRRKAPQEDL